MTTQRLLAIALSSSLCCFAAGVQAAEAPYMGLSGHYYHPDKDRSDKDGAGGNLYFGLPLGRGLSLETQVFGSSVNGSLPGSLETVAGAGLDLRVLLGQNRYLTPFVLAGLGATQTDLDTDDHVDPYLNAGVGALIALGNSGFSARTDARIVGIADTETTQNKWLKDYRVALGLEYSFGSGNTPAQPAALPAAAAPVLEEEVVQAEIDSDQDQVPDSIDECPGSAPAIQADAKGCLIAPLPLPDGDRDGIPNAADKCLETPEGTSVDAQGCSLDLDNDGIPNDQDACADTADGLKVDARGCVITQTLVLNNILFASASADLLDESKKILDGIASSLQSQPGTRVVVIGHTDALGTQASNLMLSQQRAKTVLGYLVSKGVSGDRLESEGYGEFNPVASDETEAGRAQNRRVEFRIVTQP